MYSGLEEPEFIPLRALPKGGRIALTSPASTPDSEKLKRGMAYLEQRGYSVIVGETCHTELDYLAGDDALRANELLDFIEDDSIDAVFCTRGGFGSMKILRMLDYELILEKRKLITGFSDLTALQWAIYSQTGLPSVSGMLPAVDFCADSIPENEEKAFWNLIENGTFVYPFQQVLPSFYEQSTFSFSGKIMAGNLSLVNKLLGTRYFPDLSDMLVVLEDVDEPTHKLEGYFDQLSLSDVLKDCKALFLGDFSPAKKEDYPVVPNLDTLIRRVFSHVHFPIYSGFPYGHIPAKLSIPLGLPVCFENETKPVIYSEFNLFEK